MNRLVGLLCIVGAIFTVSTPSAFAVSLNPDGIGQALLYPYYTVRVSHGSPYNTLISVANHAADVKALRVRFREGRNSREVAAFNLFLSPNDVWTAGVVPTTNGARLISFDNSCVSPQLTISGTTPGLDFSNANYVGDGNGDDLDRVREGWIEIVEMATLTGASAAAVTHATSSRTPPNCGAVQGSAPLETSTPSGGIGGTVTLINVINGLEYSLNAVALADLATAAYYRPTNDPYPGFDATEIRPMSVVNANGFIYRSVWSRGVDAVSAVLMHSSWMGEFNLEAGALSTTDFVVTFPTKQFYVTNGVAAEPFGGSCAFARNDTFTGDPVDIFIFDREEFGGGVSGFNPFPVATNFRCGATTAAVDFHNSSPHTAFTPETTVFGSINRALAAAGYISVGSASNGWAAFSLRSGKALTSLPSSSRINIATGTATDGAHQFLGLPVIGFAARTFANGTLTCGTATCQGNYGGALPLRFKRSITPSS